MGIEEHDEEMNQAMRMAGAMATCGTLIHFVLEDEELTERFVRYVQPQFGDDGGTVAARELVVQFLRDTHDFAAPGCPDPMGPTRKEEDREG